VTAPAATSTEKEVTSSGSDAKPVARAVQDATARADDLGKMIEEEVNLFGEDLFAGSSSSKVGRVRVIGEASVKLIDADKTRYDPGSSTPIGTYDVEATFPSGNVVLLRGLANVRSGRTVTLNCQARFETCTVR
jgi:hypothetical protein